MKNKSHNFILKGQWSPKLTLILGLEAKSPKIFPSLSIFGPSPRIKEELTLDCHLIFIHWISMHGTHTSKHLSHQRSLLFSPLTHSRPKTHPHTPQKSIPNSLSLEEQSSLLLQKFRESRSFTRRIHHQNHYLGKLMLGSMLWTPSYLQKSLLNSHEIINLCLRTP
mgnify:CR=1 FL=1